jgi:hypothetical protein
MMSCVRSKRNCILEAWCQACRLTQQQTIIVVVVAACIPLALDVQMPPTLRQLSTKIELGVGGRHTGSSSTLVVHDQSPEYCYTSA